MILDLPDEYKTETQGENLQGSREKPRPFRKTSRWSSEHLDTRNPVPGGTFGVAEQPLGNRRGSTAVPRRPWGQRCDGDGGPGSDDRAPAEFRTPGPASATQSLPKPAATGEDHRWRC